MSSIDKLFQDKLINHKSPAGDDVWNAIEKDLNSISNTSTTNGASTTSILSSISISLVIGSLSYLILDNTKENHNTSFKQPAHTKTEITVSEKTDEVLIVANTKSQNVTEKTESCERTKNRPTNTSAPKKRASNVVLKSPEEHNSTPIKERHDFVIEEQERPKEELNSPQEALKETPEKENLSSPSESIQKEKVFKKGEYITFTITFNNTSGEDVTSFKVWEEFPDWCDASTLETVNHNSSHEVHTTFKRNQNTVEWKVKGNFSANTNDPSNSGFIEYRIKITEDRKASELEKNQPEVD